VRGESKIFKNFIISTKDISNNNWSKPVYFEFDGFDPSLFFDDDDKIYVQGAYVLGYQGQPSTTIKQFQIDLDTGKALSGQNVIWDGFAKVSTESPHMLKKDGFYYLVVAEGGTFDGHMVSIARSRGVWGPFESCSRNPLLTASNTDHTVRHTGHADIFQSKQGTWFSVLLGVRKIDERYPMGRETFLTEVSWLGGEFPDMKPITNVSGHEVSVTPKSFLRSDLLEHSAVYIRNPNLDMFQFEPTDQSILLTSSEVGFRDPHLSPSFVGCRQRFLNGTVSVCLDVSSSSKSSLEAGLAIYKDECRFAYISFDLNNDRINFVAYHAVADDMNREVHEKLKTVKFLRFRLVCTEKSYKFEYSVNEEGSFQRLGEVDTKQFTWNDFTGTVFGVFAKGSGAQLRFSNFSANETSDKQKATGVAEPS
jgi:beta-xylosidase